MLKLFVRVSALVTVSHISKRNTLSFSEQRIWIRREASLHIDIYWLKQIVPGQLGNKVLGRKNLRRNAVLIETSF